MAVDPKAKKIEQFESYYSENYKELVYVHADKKLYLAGEHIKFKIYCLEQSKLNPSELSKVAYLEILDAENIPKLQVKISLKDGIGYGDVLIPANLNSGNFILRAYTRWMQNYGAETFHHSMITIINPFRKAGLVPIPEKNDISLSFFPEGGVLINGEKAKVVFEAFSSNNYPVNFTGKLYANDTILITKFDPIKNGMGSFEFVPDTSEMYHVELTLKDSSITRHDLPAAREKGLLLKIGELKNKFEVHVFCNDQSIANDADILFYIIHGNGRVVEHNNISLSKGRMSFDIEKTLLDAGVSTISLFNSKGEQLAVRSIFKNNIVDGLSISLDKNKFGVREKVTIDISALGGNLPLDSINLSISVSIYQNRFKNNMYKLPARLLLKTSLKNHVLNSESYFEGPETALAIDNLLIAYGNQNFTWYEKKSIDQIKYVPEYQGQLITGKVWNKSLNEPARSVITYLSFPGKNGRIYASKSKRDGRIVFEVMDIYGDKEMVVQNDYTKGTIYDIQIDNAYFEEYIDCNLPVFDLDESLKDWIKHLSQNMQIENANWKFQPKLPLLSVVDSSSFYNEPDYQYHLDDYTRFIVMEEVMREYVTGVNVRKNKKGFHFMTLDLERREIYDDNPLMLLDGVPIFDANEIIALNPLKIQKIETVNRRFFKGDLDCKGIVNYSTYDGELAGYQLHENSIVLDYDGVQPTKKYYFPQYPSSYTRKVTTPDFRNTLYWNPEIRVSSSEHNTIEFYTSDDQNNYIIQIEGISDSGIPYSVYSLFEVSGK